MRQVIATEAGHRALGGRLGSGRIARDEPADLAVFDLGRDFEDPLEALLSGHGRTLAVYVGGEVALSSP